MRFLSLADFATTRRCCHIADVTLIIADLFSRFSMLAAVIFAA